MERLLLRLFHEHREGEIAILIDRSASMGVGGPAKFNYARAAAAALAYVAMAGLDRVLAIPLADTLEPPLRLGRDRRRIFDLLDFLQSLRPLGRTRLLEASNLLAARHPSVCGVLLISDLLDCRADLSDALVRLGAARRDVAVIHVCSPYDARPEAKGSILLEAAEDSARLAVDVTPEVLAGYAAEFSVFCTDCQHACLSRSALYAAAPTDLPFESLVLETLLHASVLTQGR
jgi:uncharacterized protein (DUF58 family)